MSTNIDATPIPISRVRRTQSIKIEYDNTGALTQLIATRLTTFQQAGVDITAPVYSNFTIQAAQVPTTIANQLAALANRIDQIDNAP
jgi:hypothetical protein